MVLKWRTTSFAEDDETAGLQLHKPLTLVEIEKRAIYSSLKRNQWKRMATCRELGISKDKLCRKIILHGINSQDDDLI